MRPLYRNEYSCDKERRQISKEQATAFAEQNGILYFETSAKRGTQVDNVGSCDRNRIICLGFL